MRSNLSREWFIIVPRKQSWSPRQTRLKSSRLSNSCASLAPRATRTPSLPTPTARVYQDPASAPLMNPRVSRRRSPRSEYSSAMWRLSPRRTVTRPRTTAMRGLSPLAFPARTPWWSTVSSSTTSHHLGSRRLTTCRPCRVSSMMSVSTAKRETS